MFVFRFGFRFGFDYKFGFVFDKIVLLYINTKDLSMAPNYTNLLNIYWLMCYIYYIVYEAGVYICV